MKRTSTTWFAVLGVAALLALAPAAWAQPRPFIGYTYPAGGQVGTTFQIRLGGQNLDDVDQVLVTGSGVTARVVEYYRRLNNQELQMLREQLAELKRAPKAGAPAMAPAMAMDNTMMMMTAPAAGKTPAAAGDKLGTKELIEKIERRTREWVQVPACASIASLALVEVTIAPGAALGMREIRLITPRGASNPLAFEVSQFGEYARKPMITATIQILGKEANALRKRPADEAEDRVVLPCTVNGQIASGEVNRYRFEATKGQRLVLSTQARQLIPYIADAVPGWFQPVLEIFDAQGKEVAFDDDYRFKPDPVILFEVPKDGEYVFAIHDSIYRGREDFVYRITVGELPFVTSIYPLGGQAGAAITPGMVGINLQDADLSVPPKETGPGLQSVVASRVGFASNRVPYLLDRLPDEFDREPNNSVATAQKIALPVIVNGRIDKPGDWDVYEFTGKAKTNVVVEVEARRLDSPLDSVVKLTDATGRVIAFNDDREDLAAGLNTHHADSYLMAKLPADGPYYVHIGDTAHSGGEEYGYRLRVSAPQPDFELRVVPSSVSLPANSTTTLTVYAARKDGFDGPIKLTLAEPPAGFGSIAVSMPGNQTVARLNVKGSAMPTKGPVKLSIVGTAKIAGQDVTHQAVPAEDRMQAFLWRHLVPASELLAVVFDRNYQPPPKRVPPPRPVPAIASSVVAAVTPVASPPGATSSAPAATAGATTSTPPKPKFTKQQIVGRLRELKRLYEEGLITDAFYDAKVSECETAQ